MMEALRAKTGGWIAKIFIGVLALSFAVWGIADVFRGGQSETLAEVGQREISAENFQQTFQRQVLAYSRQLGQSLTPAQARQLGLDRQVLNEMLSDAALEAQAARLEIAVPARLVAQQIAQTPQFQNLQGQFDAAQFRQLLAANGISEELFLASEAAGMLRSAVSAAAREGLEPPEVLQKLAYEQGNEQRDVRYIEVTLDEGALPEPSESDLKTFYEANPPLFAEPERRVIAAIQVTPETLADRMTVDEATLRMQFEQRKDEFGEPERRTVEQIAFTDAEAAQAAYEAIQGGTTFEEVAAERGLSQEDMALGTFTRRDFPDQSIADDVFALEEGTVSAPIEGRLSTVLVKVTDVEAGKAVEFAEAREEIAQRLRVEQARDAVLDVYEKVEEARASGQTFSDIARTLELDVVTTPPVTADGLDAAGNEIEGLVAQEQVLRAAFESDVGVENDVVNTPDDGFVWLEVRDVVPAATRPFEEAKDDVREAWLAAKRRELLLERAQQLKQRAEAGTPIADLADDLGTELRSVTGARRRTPSDALDMTAIDALFAAPRDGYAVAVAPDGRSAKLMKSIPVQGTPFDPNAAEARSIANVLEQSLEADIRTQFTSDLQRSLGVEIDEAVWNRLSSGT